MALAALLLLAGCAAREMASESPAPQSSLPTPAAKASEDSPAALPGSVQPVAATVRKIIYNADVDLVAEDLTAARQQLVRLVSQRHGYVDETELGGTPGAPREGRWKVRVPAEEFEAFVEDLGRVGELQRVHSDSQDVTEEYYDVQARLANKKVEEERLLRHLRESPGRLTDILAVEKELSRVREEAERLQGRLQVMTNLTSLSTITIRINEVRDFVPGRSASLGQEVARTFGASLGLMRDFGRGLVLLVVALAPWAALAVALGAAFWWLLRRFPRRRF